MCLIRPVSFMMLTVTLLVYQIVENKFINLFLLSWKHFEIPVKVKSPLTTYELNLMKNSLRITHSCTLF